MTSKILLGTFSLGSLFMIISGTYYQEWWAGFGLVLFMTSLIGWVAFQFSPNQFAAEKSNESQSQRAA